MIIENELQIRSWCESALKYAFKHENSIFISQYTLARETAFGIERTGNVFILLKEELYSSPFKIEGTLELTSAQKFASEHEDSILYGHGLIINASSVHEQSQSLCLIHNILSGEDYQNDLESFFELLRKAAQKKKRFYPPSLFAELCVLMYLRQDIPEIVCLWKSSGQSVFDIRSSEKNPEIEIKSTTNIDSRVHVLSLHQVRHFLENPGSLLASVQVHEDNAGSSCKTLCEELLVLESANIEAAKILTSYLLAFSSEPGFSQALFNQSHTQSSIKLVSPDFTELQIMSPPAWLISGRFEIDLSIVPSLETIKDTLLSNKI